MKMKKINAALGLLSIVFMLLHIGYTVYAYLTFYYNPFLKMVFSPPSRRAAWKFSSCPVTR